VIMADLVGHMGGYEVKAGGKEDKCRSIVKKVTR
jgi:hypothetical protein